MDIFVFDQTNKWFCSLTLTHSGGVYEQTNNFVSSFNILSCSRSKTTFNWSNVVALFNCLMHWEIFRLVPTSLRWWGATLGQLMSDDHKKLIQSVETQVKIDNEPTFYCHYFRCWYGVAFILLKMWQSNQFIISDRQGVRGISIHRVVAGNHPYHRIRWDPLRQGSL